MEERDYKKRDSFNNGRNYGNRDGFNRNNEGNRRFNNRRKQSENEEFHSKAKRNFGADNESFENSFNNNRRFSQNVRKGQKRSFNPNFRNNYIEQEERHSKNFGEKSFNEKNFNNRNFKSERNRINEDEVFVREKRSFAPRQRSEDYNPNAKYSKKKQMIYKNLLADPNEPMRLNKYLANAGICSRREADEFIAAGVVTVNDNIVTELGTKVKRSDIVKFHDQLVSIENKVYILLNKPKDCVTTTDDPQERKTVLDLVKGACDERIYPVGRLDRNTTGVILLTNDGELASKLTHPKFLKKKIYFVTLDKSLTRADMDAIASGITLEDGEIHADEINYTSEDDKSQVGIEIHSGKNRIVRRIFESLGYKVKKLDRVLFAGLTKKGLRRGQWRFLTEKEVNMLKMGAFE